MDLITLRAGDAAVELAPEAGGSVTRYWIERGPVTREWLRPTPAGALRAGHPELAAAFPLVPYSNRIRAGRFSFRGRSVVEPLNRPPERHAIHGHGWQARWQPTEVTAATARLEYRHPAGAWPWAYHATQRFILTPSELTVELGLSNQSTAPMPAGLGWHPYFPRTARVTIAADVRAMWLTDEERMPTERVAPPAPPFGRGRDNCFVGWSRRVTIDWPELGARLVMRATPPLDYLVVFTPARRPFFCVEPVSHVTDAFNLAEAGRSDSGTLVLEPGETLRTAVVLTPEL
ncbi:MAG TPA: aldose 1-epimerase [Candidatus Udaeobacter sp.]|nr:aldose 1-epimerase [Candidatus Udaeobacter sp.]